MPGEIALDSTMAIRFLNGDPTVVAEVTSLPGIVLPLVVVGELLYGAENSARPLENLPRFLQFVDACTVLPIGRDTAASYSRTRFALRHKGRPIPENDVWIAAQCLENGWILATGDDHFSHVDGLTVRRW